MTGVSLVRHLPAPPERVWRALTEPQALAAWFWPPSFRTVASADPRPGGGFRIASTTAELAVQGVYTLVDPPSALAFTWRWDGEETTTVVTIALTADGDGTRLVLTHEQFADDAERDNHTAGWSDCLARLPGYLDNGVDPTHATGLATDPSGAPPT